MLKLPLAARIARVSLARAGGFLEVDDRRPHALAATFARLLSECPLAARESKDALMLWGHSHGVSLVPTSGQRLRSGRVQLSFSCTRTGRALVASDAKLVVAGKDVVRFGKALRLTGKTVIAPSGQKNLKDYFKQSSTTQSASSACESPATPLTRLRQASHDDSTPSKKAQKRAASPPTSPRNGHQSSSPARRTQKRDTSPATPLRRVLKSGLDGSTPRKLAPRRPRVDPFSMIEGGRSMKRIPRRRRWVAGILCSEKEVERNSSSPPADPYAGSTGGIGSSR